jgi:hypothetical protein
MGAADIVEGTIERMRLAVLGAVLWLKTGQKSTSQKPGVIAPRL